MLYLNTWMKMDYWRNNMRDILKWKEFQLDQIVPDIHNAKSYNNSDLMDSDEDDYIY